MSEPKTVLVLGGGVGGIAAARELRKHLSREHRVLVVDREREHVFGPSLLWLMAGLLRPEASKRPLSRLERRGIEARNIAARIAGRPGEERFNGYGACFVEVGGGKAAFGDGNFYAEPRPKVKLRAPSRRWHLGKVPFEKSWLNFKL